MCALCTHIYTHTHRLKPADTHYWGCGPRRADPTPQGTRNLVCVCVCVCVWSICHEIPLDTDRLESPRIMLYETVF